MSKYSYLHAILINEANANVDAIKASLESVRTIDVTSYGDTVETRPFYPTNKDVDRALEISDTLYRVMDLASLDADVRLVAAGQLLASVVGEAMIDAVMNDERDDELMLMLMLCVIGKGSLTQNQEVLDAIDDSESGETDHEDDETSSDSEVFDKLRDTALNKLPITEDADDEEDEDFFKDLPEEEKRRIDAEMNEAFKEPEDKPQEEPASISLRQPSDMEMAESFGSRTSNGAYRVSWWVGDAYCNSRLEVFKDAIELAYEIMPESRVTDICIDDDVDHNLSIFKGDLSEMEMREKLAATKGITG